MADSLRLAFPNRTVLDFRFDVVDLPRLEGERYLSEANAAALALASRMRLDPGKKVGDAVRFVESVVGLGLTAEEREIVMGFFFQYRPLEAEEELQMEEEFA